MCIDDVEKRDFDLDWETRGQLHVDEVLQLLEVCVRDRKQVHNGHHLGTGG